MSRLAELTAKIDGFFARVEARHGDDMQCRTGCSDCCHVQLSITAVEADAIRAHVAGWETDRRRALAEVGPHCPALDAAGRCKIYDARPVVCRSHGVPIRLREGSLPVIRSCHRNFTRTEPAADCVLDQETLSTLVLAVDRAAGHDGTRIELADLLSELAASPERQSAPPRGGRDWPTSESRAPERASARRPYKMIGCAPPMHEVVVPLDHPRFHHVWAAVFTHRLVADCMTHHCKMVERHPHADKLDACCQYGCDVDLFEREAILARADDIRPLLRAEVRDLPWFDDEIEEDPDYPSGKVVRTAMHGDGCLFLAHDRRGCAIHRASIERGWDFRGVKPAICRLFPLSYEEDTIVIADEYPEYSCAHVDGPTLYRLTRETLADVFDRQLVVAMDAAEAHVLADVPRRLPVL